MSKCITMGTEEIIAYRKGGVRKNIGWFTEFWLGHGAILLEGIKKEELIRGREEKFGF